MPGVEDVAVAKSGSVTCRPPARQTYTTLLYWSSSSLEYPFWWIIFICLTIVLFPDSPDPATSA
jgi:hypothetical protein